MSLMSFFSASASVPKTAWTLLPTSMTPAAPIHLALVVDLDAKPRDAGVHVDEVLAAPERLDHLFGLAVGRDRCGHGRGGHTAAAGRHGGRRSSALA
jgi:hypothetical protein